MVLTQGQYKKIDNNNYEILIDNTIPTEIEIIDGDKTRLCWLKKAEYDITDKYKAIYKAY